MRSRQIMLAFVVATVVVAGNLTARIAADRSADAAASTPSPSPTPSEMLCTMVYESEFDLDDPQGYPTAADAIAADRYASKEPGLVERIERDDRHVFDNGTAGFVVVRYAGEWVVASSAKRHRCDDRIDPFTGEALE